MPTNPKPQTKMEDIADELGYVLNELLKQLPTLDYARAPIELIEAVHSANDTLRQYAPLLAL